MPRLTATPSKRSPSPRRPSWAGYAAACGALAVVAGMLAVAPAMAAGLMEPLPASEQASMSGIAPASPYTSSARLVRIDLGYLESNLVPRGIDKARDRIRRAPPAGSARIDLLPGVSVTLDREALRKAHGGGFIWSGKVRGGISGYADLVISNDQITGQIQTGNRVFRITPVSGTTHRIAEVDGSNLPGDIMLPAPSTRNNAPGGGKRAGSPRADMSDEQAVPPSAKPKGMSYIRVLMPYTNDARKRVGAIKQVANLAIRLANRALITSRVNARFRLVGTMRIKRYYGPGQKYESTLRALTTGRRQFAVVHRIRNRKRADLVAMLRTGNELCGIAWYNPNPSPSSAPYGFSVSNVDCVTTHVVAHEMGHNAGLLHDRYVTSPRPPNSAYNFGYVNLKARIVSIMAYNFQCYDNGFSCVTVAMYSTPRVKYLGAKIGVSKGRRGAADAARRLNQTARAVARFR